jgi:hypothetical protein
MSRQEDSIVSFVVDLLGREKPLKALAPKWATHVGKTPEGAWHWLSGDTAVESGNSDRYFPQADRTMYTGASEKKRSPGLVIPLSDLEEYMQA